VKQKDDVGDEIAKHGAVVEITLNKRAKVVNSVRQKIGLLIGRQIE